MRVGGVRSAWGPKPDEPETMLPLSQALPVTLVPVWDETALAAAVDEFARLMAARLGEVMAQVVSEVARELGAPDDELGAPDDELPQAAEEPA